MHRDQISWKNTAQACRLRTEITRVMCTKQTVRGNTRAALYNRPSYSRLARARDTTIQSEICSDEFKANRRTDLEIRYLLNQPSVFFVCPQTDQVITSPPHADSGTIRPNTVLYICHLSIITVRIKSAVKIYPHGYGEASGTKVKSTLRSVWGIRSLDWSLL